MANRVLCCGETEKEYRTVVVILNFEVSREGSMTNDQRIVNAERFPKTAVGIEFSFGMALIGNKFIIFREHFDILTNPMTMLETESKQFVTAG
jgi:hypothetical protein